MDIPSLSSSQWIAFLPVFFAVLDPARIPHPDILEELAKHAKAQEDIACASVALDGIFRLGGQGDRGLFLWPRVWQWVEFIHTYREQLGEIELIPEITFYFDFIDFARTLQSQSDAFALMTETRGFWACIVQSWTFLAEERDGYPRDCSILLSNLGAFLGESGLRSHPERLEEMIDAAGSMDQLAGLVVEHIRTVINHPASDGQRPVEDLYRILSFVAAADQIPEESGHNCVGRPLGPLGAALYTRGCAEEVVEAIFFLCDSEDSAMNYVLHQCVMLLAGMILTSPVTLRHELLERGLLRALVTITLQYEAREWQWIYENVRFFLYYLLPTSLVYFRAVLAYRDALKEVQDLISGDDFKNTGLFGEWENFLASAEERLEALAEFQSASFKPQKACDNRECGRIQESCYLKRCSECQVFHYCSVECQRKDWRRGHQTACRSHTKLLLSGRASEPQLTFKERSFLRALLHHKYLKARRSICMQQVGVLAAQMNHSPDAVVGLFTMFDYCTSPPTITVYPIDASDPEAQSRLHNLVACTESEEWLDLAERAQSAASPSQEGPSRHQLHGIRVHQRHGMCAPGMRPPVRTWVIPLRTDGDGVSAGLMRLAQKMRVGELVEADLMDEIDSLLQSEYDIVEIH